MSGFEKKKKLDCRLTQALDACELVRRRFFSVGGAQ